MTRYAKTIEIVTFDELSDKAKEKARDWYRQAHSEDDSDIVIEDFEQRLAELGYPTSRVEYGLGFCQGDYVSFFGRCDQYKLLERLGLLSDPRFTGDETPTIEIKRFGGCHGTYMNLEISGVEDKSLHDALCKAVGEDVRSTAITLMREGHATLLDLGSDETVDQSILDNEYTFTLDGKRMDV